MKINVLQPSCLTKAIRNAYRDHIVKWDGCVRCEIGKMAKHHVFARGTLPCDLLVIGEGPGKDENESGYPFVGRCGEMLEDWLAHAERAYDERNHEHFRYAITNLVCCRPTLDGKDRQPDAEEVFNCAGRLQEFVTTIARPSIVVLVGRQAQEHGWFFRDNYRTLDLYHPSHYLRSGGLQSPAAMDAAKSLTAFVLENL